MPHFIETYCSIANGEVVKDNERIFSSNEGSLSIFLKEIYNYFNLQYPRFFKMDALSKLAFLGSEILLEKNKTSDVGIVLSNSAASLETDRKHLENIVNSNYEYANPSVFVYTLPNICIGEISIRNSFHTESAFFVMEKFSPEMLYNYSESLLDSTDCAKVLCGWVDVDNDKYESLLYLVSEEGSILHNPNEIKKIYEHAARGTEG